jgi:metal-responsive CopG/Arc/MetJ family transcriptional regulator
MKIAISISDDLFEQAERLARQEGTTRNHLYSSAVREYLARHAPDEVTAAMDRVCEVVGEFRDPLLAAAAQRTMEHVEW